MQSEQFYSRRRLLDERNIEYASNMLTSAEQNHHTTERDAPAVVWSVQKFREYLEGVKFVIKSDHKSLKWFMSLRSPNTRLAGWALTYTSVI